MLFQRREMYYKFAFLIGTYRKGNDALPFTKVSGGSSCIETVPPRCAAIELSSIHWSLHESVSYYITVKAENTVGLYVLATTEYTHFTESPSGGVVYDVDPQERRQVSIFSNGVVLNRVFTISVKTCDVNKRLREILFVLTMSINGCPVLSKTNKFV